MKTRLPLTATFAALLGCAAFDAPAQTPASTVTWAQSYGVGFYDQNGQPSTDTYSSTGIDVPVGTAPMPDGGLVVAGNVGLPEVIHNGSAAYSRGGLVVVRYGRSGGILWQKHLRSSTEAAGTDTSVFLARSVRADAAGNVFVLCTSTNASASHSYVAKLSPAGDLLWQNAAVSVDFIAYTGSDGNPGIRTGSVYGIGNGSGLGAANGVFDLTSDGGVIVGNGLLEPTGFNNAHNIPFIYKFNADGSVAFHRGYELLSGGATVTSICARQNNAGYALLLPQLNNADRALIDIVLTDAAGNPVAQRTFCNNGDYNPLVIVASADGGFFFTSAGNNGGIVVHKLRADLSLVWQKVINDFNGYGVPTPTPDGGCILPAQTSYLGLAILTTLDADGNVTASHDYGTAKGVGYSNDHSTPWSPVAPCLTSDGTVAFSVNTFDYGSNSTDGENWWVVKTDALGNVLGYNGTSLTLPTTSAAFQTPADFASSDWGAAPNNEVNGGNLATTSQPAILLEDLGTKTDLNKPSAQFQANAATSYNHRLFFGGEVYLGSGAFYLQFAGSGNPFGYYSYLTDPNYVFHFDLGYEYVFDANDGKSGVYLYDFKSNGFFYTSPAFPFPYLYDFSLNTVLYYYPDPSHPGHYNTDGYRFFYRFDNGQIIVK